MNKKMKILVVDDDEFTRMKIYHMLVDEFEEGSLLFADTIVEARSKVFKNNISVILLDIYLPGENGADFMSDILDNEKLKGIPIIVITGTEPTSIVKTSFESYVHGYLHKPLDKKELIKSIKSAIHLTES